ncbi:hypothetical protein [Acinetobacter sp. MB5]|uniref:hypothetical protein n=1 Tax=Acinetobacter sp. MB5 TaxID=2069438 RepID=UPI000DD0905B|nr:hypothetical protein [Acinetobacter sp. MB5]
MSASKFVKKFGWDEAKYIVVHDRVESTVNLDDLKRLVESHELIEHYEGLEACKDMILSVYSDQSEYGNQLGVEYKKSSENPKDKSLMLCDDGAWIGSAYLNHELDNPESFINLKRLKQAIEDEESCQ